MGDFFTFAQVDRLLGRCAGSPLPQGIRAEAQARARREEILKNDLYAAGNDLLCGRNGGGGRSEVEIDNGPASA
jgi:hypothetical protein